MAKVTPKQIREAVDMISTGLLVLEQAGDELLSWPGKPFVDAVAKLSANYQTMARIIDPLKARVKNMGTNHKPTEYIRGSLFKGIIRRFTKRYFDFGKAEKLLGSKKFQSCWVKKGEEALEFGIQG
jgi:hypothetical protein